MVTGGLALVNTYTQLLFLEFLAQQDLGTGTQFFEGWLKGISKFQVTLLAAREGILPNPLVIQW